jgi:hypothetical protein
VYAFAGVDSDGDGQLNCADTDDDNDGIPDDIDGCPIHHRDSGATCSELRDCACGTTDWWRACLGTGCVEMEARIAQVINPNPEENVIVDNIRIAGTSLYLLPSEGNTVSQVAQAMTGRAGALSRQDGPTTDLRRIELWSKATATEPSRLIAIVGEYDAATLRLDQLTNGVMLAVSTSTNGAVESLGATWFVGDTAASVSADRDLDGMPDGWEIQHGFNPGSALDALLDADADGMSNLGEYRADTHPRDPESLFKVDRMERLVHAVHLEFRATPGRRYLVERAASLTNPGWQQVGSAMLAQGGSVAVDVPGDQNAGFYRVRLLSP